MIALAAERSRDPPATARSLGPTKAIAARRSPRTCATSPFRSSVRRLSDNDDRNPDATERQRYASRGSRRPRCWLQGDRQDPDRRSDHGAGARQCRMSATSSGGACRPSSLPALRQSRRTQKRLRPERARSGAAALLALHHEAGSEKRRPVGQGDETVNDVVDVDRFCLVLGPLASSEAAVNTRGVALPTPIQSFSATYAGGIAELPPSGCSPTCRGCRGPVLPHREAEQKFSSRSFTSANS